MSASIFDWFQFEYPGLNLLSTDGVMLTSLLTLLFYSSLVYATPYKDEIYSVASADNRQLARPNSASKVFYTDVPINSSPYSINMDYDVHVNVQILNFLKVMLVQLNIHFFLRITEWTRKTHLHRSRLRQ